MALMAGRAFTALLAPNLVSSTAKPRGLRKGPPAFFTNKKEFLSYPHTGSQQTKDVPMANPNEKETRASAA